MSQQLELALPPQTRSLVSNHANADCRDQQYSYKPGSIKSIRLINFMCHESFELTLGPRVNFVIGPNGSGKSALLTAIVVAMGGRANVTSRAKRADEFVMSGKRTCKIIVIIHNFDKIMEKDLAFKPDDYGKAIIVERTISKGEAGTRLVLKNDTNKKVSERKQELDDILEHFAILINNPICILNQEISKTFLHSKRPEDKFELFMKATNLEQIEGDYDAANSYHREWRDCNESKTFGFKMLEGEYKSCKEKLSFLENRAQLNEKMVSLNQELIWALARDNEVISNEAEEKLKKIKKSISECEEFIEKRKAKIQHQDEEILMMRTKISSIQENIKQTDQKYRDTRAKESRLYEKKINAETKISACNSRINRIKRDKRSLEKSIADLKQQYKNQNALDQDNEQRKLEIERLEKDDLPREYSREKSIRNHSDQLNNSMTSLRTELYSANEKVNGVKTRIRSTTYDLQRLKNGQQNHLRKYGDFVVKIIEDVEIWNKQNRFKHKPIGPLGASIRLKNGDVAASLQHILGRNAHAFVCDNMEDMAQLNMIFRKYVNEPDYMKPPIIIRKFSHRHDVTRYKAVHSVYKTILDYLEIDGDAVFNCLVDKCNLESILFIPDYKEAESIMIDPNSVPRGTRCAYTKDCSVMYPRTANSGYRAFSNNISRALLFTDSSLSVINEEQRKLTKLNSELREAEQESMKIQESLNTQRREYDSNIAELNKILTEIRKKEERLLTLKTTIAKEPQELSALEDELENNIKEIGEEEIKLRKEQENLQEVESDLAQMKSQSEEIKRILDLKDSERRTIQLSIDKCNETKQKFKDENQVQQEIMANRLKEQKILEKKHDDALKQVFTSTQQAEQNTRRPRNIRSTAQVKEDIHKTEIQLNIDIEESQDPDELIRGLNKRIKEIENLNSLKDSNLDNFSRSSKSLAERKSGYKRLLDSTIHGVSATFSTVMRTMKMNGELEIHIEPVIEDGIVMKKARTLDMRIETNYSSSQRPMSDNCSNTDAVRTSYTQPAPSKAKRARTENNRDSGASEKENGDKLTDSRSLSGGEKSFSTVAFVLALWHHCNSPFKLMDEIDVFMDMVTRRQSYTALIRFAQVQEDPGQFIFFSPLELPKFDDSGNFVRVFEMPAIIRKGITEDRGAAVE